MKAFEKESLDMKMMPIAGTKGGKLYGASSSMCQEIFFTFLLIAATRKS
jgi:hypothetical protein